MDSIEHLRFRDDLKVDNHEQIIDIRIKMVMKCEFRESVKNMRMKNLLKNVAI